MKKILTLPLLFLLLSGCKDDIDVISFRIDGGLFNTTINATLANLGGTERVLVYLKHGENIHCPRSTFLSEGQERRIQFTCNSLPSGARSVKIFAMPLNDGRSDIQRAAQPLN